MITIYSNMNMNKNVVPQRNVFLQQNAIVIGTILLTSSKISIILPIICSQFALFPHDRLKMTLAYFPQLIAEFHLRQRPSIWYYIE